MNITVIEYDGTEHNIECESFEFRTNQVDNWIRIKYPDGSKEEIHDVCVIKAESEEDDSDNLDSMLEDLWNATESEDNDYTWAKELVDRVKK